MSDTTFELPSGKNAAGENFPVASRLLSPRLRPHLLTFYAFCRAIDDVADAAGVPAEERRRRLLAFDAVLAGTAKRGPTKAVALKRSLDATGVPAVHGRELIQAFLRDTRQARYADWQDLMSYCRLSAAPVGRHVLDLHAEDHATWPANDALCAALQIINHLQDCGDDYRELDRVYLPVPWLEAEGVGVEVLGEAASPTGLRRVVDRALDATEPLLAQSKILRDQVKDSRLCIEISVIQALAERLVQELRRRDPLAERVKLKRGAVARVALGAIGQGLVARLGARA